jgi:uroporphyrinogen-III synthase
MSKIYLCSPKVYEGAISLPMIKFNLIANSLDLEKYDALIFTSKQAVVFANSLNRNWIYKKILAVGKATAKIAKELGAKDVYNPQKFYGKTLANDIIKHFKNYKLLYIRPKVVAFDTKSFLQKEGIDIKEKIIYETVCNKPQIKSLEKNSIIIFTSPSTIECFFKTFNWDSSFKAVVIGKTTLENLPKNIKVYVAKEQTISSCVERAKEIAKK